MFCVNIEQLLSRSMQEIEIERCSNGYILRLRDKCECYKLDDHGVCNERPTPSLVKAFLENNLDITVVQKQDSEIMLRESGAGVSVWISAGNAQALAKFIARVASMGKWEGIVVLPPGLWPLW